jgi:RNA polymerase sigma factor (sigma-70 family)
MLVGDQSTAEDVVQDAFLGLYRAWDRIRDPDAVLGYLRTAVVNGTRSVHRSRGRARLLRVQHDPPVWSAEAAVMDGEDRRAVLAAIATLPQRQREVLALKYYLDLSERDVAAIMRVSRGTVAAASSRALAMHVRRLQENPGTVWKTGSATPTRRPAGRYSRRPCGGPRRGSPPDPPGAHAG